MKTYDDRSFSACAPKLWNQLPNNIWSAGSVSIFKRQLKTHLFKDVHINELCGYHHLSFDNGMQCAFVHVYMERVQYQMTILLLLLLLLLLPKQRQTPRAHLGGLTELHVTHDRIWSHIIFKVTCYNLQPSRAC